MTPATFECEVPGLGTFVFRKRTFRDQLRIEAKAAEMLGLDVIPEKANAIEQVALATETLAALIVAAPEGWSVDSLDPLDGQSGTQVMDIWGVLRKAEAGFRAGPAAQRADAGARAVEDGGLPVSPPVQPRAD